MANWYVLSGTKQQGPFTASQLKSLADSGKLQRDDQVRRDDKDKIYRAQDVKGLFPESPPPLPNAPQNRSEAMPDGPVWIVVQNGNRFGPFSDGQLAELAAAGKLFPHDQVGDGLGGWVQADSIPGLQFPDHPTENSIKPILMLAGIALGIFLLVSAIFGKGKKMRDFADNTEAYKGKSLTVPLTYEGSGLNWREDGAMPSDLNCPFYYHEVHGGSTVKFDIKIRLPRGLKVPPLRSLDHVTVTFDCTEGDLTYGNVATKIVRR